MTKGGDLPPTGKGNGDAVCTLDKKSIPMVAWYVLSNESYMNLVIRDVFPTARPCQKPLSKGRIEAIQDAYHSVLPKTPTYHSISNQIKPV